MTTNSTITNEWSYARRWRHCNFISKKKKHQPQASKRQNHTLNRRLNFVILESNCDSCKAQELKMDSKLKTEPQKIKTSTGKTYVSKGFRFWTHLKILRKNLAQETDTYRIRNLAVGRITQLRCCTCLTTLKWETNKPCNYKKLKPNVISLWVDNCRTYK